MTALLHSGRAPAEIMDLLARADRQRTMKSAGRTILSRRQRPEVQTVLSRPAVKDAILMA